MLQLCLCLKVGDLSSSAAIAAGVLTPVLLLVLLLLLLLLLLLILLLLLLVAALPPPALQIHVEFHEEATSSGSNVSILGSASTYQQYVSGAIL